MSAKSDAQYVRCLKCQKTIKCSRYDTCGLIIHIQTDHPEMVDKGNEKIQKLHKLAAEHGVSEERLSQISRMTGLSEAELADKAERYISEQQDGNETANSSAKINNLTDNTKRMCFCASIEKWRATNGGLYCPKCCCKRPPSIKTSSEVLSGGNRCVSLLAKCWPLCYLPCFASANNKAYLYCANCKAFLGLYNREQKLIRPNREYVPDEMQSDEKKKCP